MANALSLYFKYVATSVRSQMQYRAAFVMQSFGFFMMTGVEVLSVVVLFDRFRALDNWSLPEVAFLYGLVNVSFALSEGIGRGFDVFHLSVRRGEFDRMLLRPRSAALQVAGNEVQMMRAGRLAQALLVLLIASRALSVAWTPAKVFLVLFAVTGGVCLFIGLFVFQATISFWTVQSLEIVNTLTYGGCEAGKFPVSIYKRWFRTLFIFVVPLACVQYFPSLAIFEKVDPMMASPVWFQWSAPAMGVLFLAAALGFWRFGVRHYRSTGS